MYNSAIWPRELDESSSKCNLIFFVFWFDMNSNSISFFESTLNGSPIHPVVRFLSVAFPLSSYKTADKYLWIWFSSLTSTSFSKKNSENPIDSVYSFDDLSLHKLSVAWYRLYRLQRLYGVRPQPNLLLVCRLSCLNANVFSHFHPAFCLRCCLHHKMMKL